MRQPGLSLLMLLTALLSAAPGIVETRSRQISSDNRQKPNLFLLVDDIGYQNQEGE
ncbi:MAG: hypothetical protein M3R15_15320 [Acidobacteriota bacterium]|nr:hypothetical protein [Acidobacteriota bacterium]